MAKRNANGYGGVSKLKGKRTKPYMAYISEMKSEGRLISPTLQNTLKTQSEALQNATTHKEASDIFATALSLLYDDISVEEYREMLSAELGKRIKKQTFKSKQVKKPIGYYKTSSEANIALAEYNRNPYDMDKRKATFKDVYELAYKDAQIEKKSRSSVVSYQSGMARCQSLHGMPVAEIKLAHLQDIIDSNANLSKPSLTNIVKVCHLVYAYALKHDLADKDYSTYIQIKDHAEQETKAPYTREEIQLLWNNLDWRYQSTRTSLLTGERVVDILLILIHTGMRIDELLQTKSADVHLDERYMIVRGTKTKSAYRIVPLHKKIVPLLKYRLDMGGENLICNKEKKPVKYMQFKSPVFDNFVKEFNLDHSIHETRHTFATFTTTMNSTLRSYMIGHATQNITNDVYTHPEVLIPELIAEIDKIQF